jgi:DNA-binding HxlR family transcriptional regulator
MSTESVHSNMCSAAVVRQRSAGLIRHAFPPRSVSDCVPHRYTIAYAILTTLPNAGCLRLRDLIAAAGQIRVYHPDSLKRILSGLVRRRLVERVPGPSIQRQGYRLTSAGVDLQRRCLEQPLLQTPSKDTLRRKIIEAIPRNGSRANVILRRAGILERQQRSVRVILCQMVHEGLLERAKLPRIRPQTYRLTERGKSLGRAYRAIPVARC